MAFFFFAFLDNLLLLFLLTRSISCNRKERTTCPNQFCITKLTTYNMVTTVYWKSNFSHEDSGVEYILKYNCDNKWRSVSCLKPQWHKNSGEISCVILTCETTPSEEYYCEIRVEAHLNSTGNFTTTPSVLHDPISHNIPPEITNVTITRNSSSSAIISWTRPAGFCPKSRFCLEIKYHREGTKLDKLVEVPSQDNSSVITGLEPCSKYSFYLITHKEYLCSFLQAVLWTTGPFFLSSNFSSILVHSLQVEVFNLVTTMHWKQPDFCSLTSTQFNVYYRLSDVSQKWTKSYCIIQYNKINNVFSCQLLTCTETKDNGYDVEITVNGSKRQSENILHFQPLLENTPDQIRHVTTTALTSRSLKVAWKLASSFCTKFQYCVRFLYHSDSDNKSLEITEEEKKKSSTIVHHLLPYTTYYFYPVTFNPGLGCLYQSEYSKRATGPFSGTTLEDAPSSGPVLICSLCNVVVNGRIRSGVVRWQLPPKTRWNGLPRVFVIQWRENVSGALWNNKTISKIGASEGNLTGLLATKEYFVRVKMCNGEKLCSEFSKEMFIDSLEENEAKKTTSESSRGRTIGLSVGLTLPVLIAIALILFYFKYKKSRVRARINLPTATELPNLGCVAYDNIESVVSISPRYSQLSPTDDCYSLDIEPEPELKTSENEGKEDVN